MLKNLLRVCIVLTGLFFSIVCSDQDIDKYFNRVKFSYTNVAGTGIAALASISSTFKYAPDGVDYS